MSIRTRLNRLEKRPRPMPAVASLTDEERVRRADALLRYGGNDPDLLDRRQRLKDLLGRVRDRLARQRSKNR